MPSNQVIAWQNYQKGLWGYKVKFEDTEIEVLDITLPEDLSRLLIEYLCNEIYERKKNDTTKSILLKIIDNIQKNGMSYGQFNELMLFLDQDVVSEGFFNFFFIERSITGNETKKSITLADIKRGVGKFRTFALLFFGNFRFAYKALISLNDKEIETKFKSYLRKPDEIRNEFRHRQDKMLDIENIPRDKTW